ncbi:hypothetical protein Bbelb_203840 [Branchiostoma belcheri]|nr:hypothetical protein Bbelb_203840 [Branchiostoma belcheri]
MSLAEMTTTLVLLSRPDEGDCCCSCSSASWEKLPHACRCKSAHRKAICAAGLAQMAASSLLTGQAEDLALDLTVAAPAKGGTTDEHSRNFQHRKVSEGDRDTRCSSKFSC